MNLWIAFIHFCCRGYHICSSFGENPSEGAGFPLPQSTEVPFANEFFTSFWSLTFQWVLSKALDLCWDHQDQTRDSEPERRAEVNRLQGAYIWNQNHDFFNVPSLMKKWLTIHSEAQALSHLVHDILTNTTWTNVTIIRAILRLPSCCKNSLLPIPGKLFAMTMLDRNI